MASQKEALKLFLGIKLKQFRLEKNLSLKNLSEACGLSASYLNEIEKGKKYPKMEKLVNIAKALEVPFEELVSLKLTKNLGPLEKYLESEFFKELPLELFGITPNDLCDLMAQSPEKFAGFMVTLVEIARSYDLTLEQLLFAALRSYQEMHKNYFPEIEEKALSARKTFDLPPGPLSADDLANVLQTHFSYQIDGKRMSQVPELENLRTLYKKGPRPSGPHQLFLNAQLSPSRKAFSLAKELGYRVLELSKRPLTHPQPRTQSFETLLNDFKSSYFAGALLVDKNSFLKGLKNFFSQKTFRPELLQEMAEEYQVDPEVIFQRMTQLLPFHFKLDQLFFLRFHQHSPEAPYIMTKELHLSQLHGPHAIGLSEHYCRRWITVSLLADFSANLKRDAQKARTFPFPFPFSFSKETPPATPLWGAQRSTFFAGEKEYLCLSMANAGASRPNGAASMTIGLLVGDSLKKIIKFWNDPQVPRKEVSQTCERCGVEKCEVRAAPATLYEKEQRAQKKEKAIQDFLGQP